MQVKLVHRWAGNDSASPGDVIEVDDAIARHHLDRGNFVLPDAAVPSQALPQEPVDEDLDDDSKALVAASNALAAEGINPDADEPTPAPSRRRNR